MLAARIAGFPITIGAGLAETGFIFESFPPRIPVKYFVIATGDTVDSGTSSATSQSKKGFRERSRLTIVAPANPLSCLRKVRN